MLMVHSRIASTVLANLDIINLVTLASTGRDLKNIVSANMDAQTILLLSRFFVNPSFILTLLRTTRAVISGSLALRSLFPALSTDDSWVSADADLYVPRSQYRHLLSSLYVCDGYSPRTITPCPYIGRRVRKVARLSNGRTFIDLVVANSEACIDAIFSFHSTVVMNFISGYGIYSAYPALTLSHTGFVNPQHIFRNGSLSVNVATCIEKYRSRGFDITYPSKVVENCGKDPTCPHTIRSTYDHHSLFLPFNEATIGRDHGSHFIYDGDHEVVWRMGGPACYGKQDGIVKPFIQILPTTV